MKTKNQWAKPLSLKKTTSGWVGPIPPLPRTVFALLIPIRHRRYSSKSIRNLPHWRPPRCSCQLPTHTTIFPSVLWPPPRSPPVTGCDGDKAAWAGQVLFQSEHGQESLARFCKTQITMAAAPGSGLSKLMIIPHYGIHCSFHA